jgi:glycine cleavage system H protein
MLPVRIAMKSEGDVSNIPEHLLYTRDHEWVHVEGEIARLGVTDFAQRQLGDVVFVELPNVGDSFEASEPIATVESVKAVSEIYLPIGGRVTERNAALDESPELLNEDPYGEGWLLKVTMTTPSEIKALLSAEAYADYIKETEGADA